MKTLFSIFLITVWGIIASFLSIFILNIAGIPGALIAGKPQKNIRYTVGVIITILCQSFIYIAYVAYIVNWTLLARTYQKINPIIWFVAFLSALLPIAFSWKDANIEAREDKYTNAQVTALSFTFLLSFITFFIFLFIPSVSKTIYGWIPYIN